MAIFIYKAIKPNGQEVEGELILNSEDEVQSYLKKKELFIVEIKEKSDKKFGTIDLPQKVTKKDLSVFCRKLHTMLISGLPIVTALDILKEQTVNKTMKKTIQGVYENLQKGLTLSEALLLYPKIFPGTMVFLIEAGEASGKIDSILDRLAIDFDKEHKIQNQIKAAMVYPIILIIALIVLLIFMIVFILPTFIEMFDSVGAELPALTQFVIGFSKSVTKNWYLYLAGIATVVLSIKTLIVIPSVKKWIDGFKLRMPLLKKYFQLVITTRFTRTLSTMLFSGVPLLQSLENCSRAIGNVVVSEKITYVANEVRRGSSLAQPIKVINIFPRMVDSMINIGEESGTIDDILVRTTDYFEEELETTIKKMIQLFEPIMIVLMAGIVGTIVISMVLPMFDLTTTIK